MPTHKEIYERHAGEYEALVSREDHQANILSSIREIVKPDGLEVLDLGAGTGRLACLLAPYARTMTAFDLSPHMLALARDRLRQSGETHWLTAAADHRRLPVRSQSADLIVSGWSVSYVAVWASGRWREEAQEWFSEARRVLRRPGHIILFESLGTGNRLPERLPHLENFYDWLDAQGFSNRWIRTDYSFETPEIADQLVGFFFGEEMLGKIEHGERITLPECTGVWWLRV